ncbi:primosomal protein N' [Fimbriimonas ginsengisoli Gsoil 348]|uniref:Replication restart protein PriA n=1 Tax=Fimbriimonas ginsengisoli Gsoil 348 TaxID=661478 RepID=A0A068NTU5_FIMGI|nr:primosomal protein N' [Fimbriimonas ginsengisoli Gsoil 348]
MRVADVALDPRSGGAEALYTYRAEGNLTPGDAVFVPLGTRSVLGFVTSVYDATEQDLGFPFASLKSILGEVEGLGLPAALIDLCRFVAEETLCSLPVALSSASPPGVRDRLVSVWAPVDSPTEHKLTPMQEEVLRVVQENDGLIEAKGKKLPAATIRALRLLRNKGLVRQVLRVEPYAERRAKVAMLRLTADSDRVDAFLKKEGRRRPAQALTLMRLQEAESAQLTSPELRALAGVTETTIKALLEAGMLEAVDEDSAGVVRPPIPNPAQQIAIDAVVEAVNAREPQAFLLYGVTGSGKTEVYLRAAAEALRQGRQVLFLVPEIALATQAIARLRERFGRGVAVLHSDLPPAERLKNWFRIRDGQASVVLGARSALFAPLSNLGLVVMDEEHEASYKQETSPRYHAKALARYLSQRHRCPVILGSATPSVETFFEADTSEQASTSTPHPSSLTLLSLPHRAASAQLPEVLIEDLTEGYRFGKPALLCDDLHQRIEQVLALGQQVILFLNRRAYAPFVICRDCGQRMECPNCAISLSYHRHDRKLRCHHCGYAATPPDTCPKCSGLRLAPFGVGTEKVEEAVAALFPTAKVARLDRDIARRKGALEETLASFRSGEIGILVGTQMVAKGLDFPNVTLVGAIAADVSLNIPDFRSSERTFQLLSQVAGRAGRGKAHGQVVIQTFNPEHPAVRTAQAHDFLAFYEALLVERREAGYPPFRRLVNVTISGEARSTVFTVAEEVRRRLQDVTLELLGPADCAVERLQNRWRRHILLKLPPNASVAPVGEALLGYTPKGVQIVVDVDPYNLM